MRIVPRVLEGRKTQDSFPRHFHRWAGRSAHTRKKKDFGFQESRINQGISKLPGNRIQCPVFTPRALDTRIRAPAPSAPTCLRAKSVSTFLFYAPYGVPIFQLGVPACQKSCRLIYFYKFQAMIYGGFTYMYMYHT